MKNQNLKTLKSVKKISTTENYFIINLMCLIQILAFTRKKCNTNIDHVVSLKDAYDEWSQILEKNL